MPTRTDSLVEALWHFTKDWSWVLHATADTFDGEFPLDDTDRLVVDFGADVQREQVSCRRVGVERSSGGGLQVISTPELLPDIDAPFAMLADCDNGEDIGCVAVPADTAQEALALARSVSGRWLVRAAVVDLDQQTLSEYS